MSSSYGFRDSVSSGMNYLRRRFSSNDLQGDLQDEASDTAGFNFNLPKRKGPSPSAPSSPSRSTSIQGLTRGLFGGTTPSQNKLSYNKEKCKTLLIVDSPSVDWGKYFRNKKLFGDWDLRVEQAEFSEINLASYSDTGAVVDIQVVRNGTKVVRSFKPDFVLVRQHVKDANEDWKNIIIGLHYGGVPSINSFSAVYNFLDKPWVFSQLIQIQQRLGRAKFPLIEQSYYPDHKEMLISPQFPVVVKIGHAHSGLGAVKIDSHYDYQDITTLVALSGCYCITEPYVDSKYDIHVQKIGNNYKAFTRTSISGNWKVNTGSSMLEQIPMNDKYRLWVNECSQLFGGLDMVAVEAIMAKDGNEYILEINDSSMPLLGETQEEDRRVIADLIISKMEVYCKPTQTELNKLQRLSNEHQGRPTHPQPALNSRPMAGPPGPSPQMSASVNTPKQTSENSSASSQPPHPATVDAVTRDLEDNEDTMKNLRKTFAGIFGNM